MWMHLFSACQCSNMFSKLNLTLPLNPIGVETCANCAWQHRVSSKKVKRVLHTCEHIEDSISRASSAMTPSWDYSVWPSNTCLTSDAPDTCKCNGGNFYSIPLPVVRRERLTHERSTFDDYSYLFVSEQVNRFISECAGDKLPVFMWASQPDRRSHLHIRDCRGLDKHVIISQ